MRTESTLHTGESPVKKNTGELEPILPQWLRDVRQQARESAAEEAAARSAHPKVQNEPPDLLAGLASQTREAEEDVPDWLASINPEAKPKPVEPEPSKTDFFSQFTRNESKPAEEEAGQEAISSWMAEPQPVEKIEEKDELSDWFARAAAEPEQTVEIDHDAPFGMEGSDLPSFKITEPEPPKEEEDLSWLHSLESSVVKPAPHPETIREEAISSLPPSAEGEDLSWLNELGGIQSFTPETPAPTQEVKPEPFTPAPPAEPQEDMSWLDKLAVPEASAEQEPAPVESASQEMPDWLSMFAGQTDAAEEKPAGEDLGWPPSTETKTGSETPPAQVAPFEPSRTGPLEGEPSEEYMPDWLKSATEEPSMPAPGGLSEWFREPKSGDRGEIPLSTPESFDQTQGKSVSPESPSLSGQDVESLLGADMPDWFSSTESRGEEKSLGTTQGSDSLAPVDLPAWVQAMRPVESVIAETPSLESQPTEKEGPLAGLRGVIPAAPIGSALRPKPISLKLQANDEQQAGAVLLEQILAGESNPKPLTTTAYIASQQILRRALSGLFILVLSVMIVLGTQSMPVSAALPSHVSSVANAIAGIPSNSSVLIILDYEPALAGELEAVSGPMLDQMTLLSRPRLSFLATSPNSSALVDRLLRNTNISLPPPNGLDYQFGADYFKLGYLPGGASGVLEFVESPVAAMPSAGVNGFSEYAAVILLTDHSESARVWVEQLDSRKQVDPSLANQPLLVAASAQAGPLLQPYVSSRQITGMINGIADAARYEFVNNSRPGIVRRYWDTFGVGLFMAILIIAFGSLWSLVAGLRARRTEAEWG